MIEKRFEVDVDNLLLVWDTEKNKRLEIEDIVDLLNALHEENEQLRQKIKHCVYVDVDNANGCMNCKYDKGSICSILNCGTHDYLEGVSECGLKYWECKDE